ncbi:MAG TPA: hypothetical protein QF901_06795 [Gammaproteobacteria bacterium]|nr:hypothetical protein [Gammaproteobacteria bacterium]
MDSGIYPADRDGQTDFPLFVARQAPKAGNIGRGALLARIFHEGGLETVYALRSSSA